MNAAEFIASLTDIGWSNKKFAERSGISYWHVRRIEEGKEQIDEAVAYWLRLMRAICNTPPPVTAGVNVTAAE